jgi:hypothetical protein
MSEFDPIEKAVVLDEFGAIEMDIAFIRRHPDWYRYIGHYRVNGILYHSFRLAGS